MRNLFLAVVWLSFFSISLLFLAAPAGSTPSESTVNADQTPAANKNYFIALDAPTIAKGYTVAAFDDVLKLSLVPGILSEATGIDIIELHENLSWPWSLDLISDVYQFEFRNKRAYDDTRPFYIQFSYIKDSPYYKQVFFYDKNYQTWRPLPTRDFPDEQFVRSLIHLPFARIAVFAYPDVLTVGRASWYAYKGGDWAASPDFPKDSRLRVYDENKTNFVDVVVNDYGPDRSLHPDRAVDLDKIAFAKLAPLGQGMMDVIVEPLYIASADNKILGIGSHGIGAEPDTTIPAFVIMAEESGEIILSRQATSALPIASLTKLVAIAVFLETKPSLNKEVAYSLADEEYNYAYCQPWESAKLNLDEGETLTVEDLVYASLVGSANNTVETLVRASGLNRDEFIAKMNDLVYNWGASSTRFVEPTGLAPENVSSCLDYAIITNEVYKHPILNKASIAGEYSFNTINKDVRHRLKNTNSLFKLNKYNITGSKTGYLNEAGYCLMTRVKAANGDNLIIVTLGADSRARSFSETEDLIRFGLWQVK